MQALLRRSGLYLVLLTLLGLAACGADNNSYTPTRDTVTVEAQIHFDPAQKMIIIDTAEPTARSSLITPCEISFVSQELSFELASEAKLILNNSEFTYVKDLAAQEPIAGVPESLYAVWTAEAQNFEGGVSNQIEIEILPKTLLYRNICLR